MSVRTSAIPDLKDAVVDGLKARVSVWNGVQVLTEPAGDDAKLEHFWLTDEESNLTTMTLGGALSRINETGSVGFELVACVKNAGETGSRAARDRAYLLLADLMQFLAADYTSGGLSYKTHIDSTTGTTAWPESLKGRAHEIKGSIGFAAVLTPGG